jgi:hypothetical protein
LATWQKIVIIFLILFFQILVLVRDQAAALRPELNPKSVRSLGAGRRALFRFVYLPASLPAILTGVRQSIGTAVAVLYVAELFATRYGLGYYILLPGQHPAQLPGHVRRNCSDEPAGRPAVLHHRPAGKSALPVDRKIIMKSMRAFFDLIKFEHTIFALPFAYLGMLLAARGFPSFAQFFWITVAMAAARTLAMGFNRIADRYWDARNPRTRARPLVSGSHLSAHRLDGHPDRGCYPGPGRLAARTAAAAAAAGRAAVPVWLFLHQTLHCPVAFHPGLSQTAWRPPGPGWP